MRHVSSITSTLGRLLFVGAVLASRSVEGAQPSQTTQLAPSVSFTTVGNDSGFLISSALNSLIGRGSVTLRAIPAAGDRSPADTLRAHYGLPAWVDVGVLVRQLCGYNPGSCRTKGDSNQEWSIGPSDAASPPLDPNLCRGDAGAPPRSTPSHHLCVPDVTVTLGTTYVTRILRDQADKGTLTRLVVDDTRGCVSFDITCQRQIASRNANKLFESGSIDKSGLFATDATTTSVGEWWHMLTGDLTLPAAAVTVSVPTRSEESATAQNAPSTEDGLCDSVVQAVLDTDHSFKLANGITSAYSYVIATDCRTVAHKRETAPQQRALGGKVTVDQAFASQVLREARTAMKLSVSKNVTLGHPLLGVWDGPITDGPELERQGGYPRLSLRPAFSDPGRRILREANVLGWVDPFPATGFGDPPAAACGAPIVQGEQAADHATVIASMLAGRSAGLLPNARLWSYIWDPRRLEIGKSSGPSNAWEWFERSVVEAPQLDATTVANLSCGTALDERSEADAYSELRANLAGIRDPADTTTVAPYVLGIAAPNRPDESWPTVVDAMVTPSGMPKPGGGGFPFLARNRATSGAISVVALSPRGDDVLRCGDVQRLIARARLAGFETAGDRVTNFCPATPETPARLDDDRPLVVSGTAFDVGAVGFGTGGGEDGKPIVMWGSSFAAPHVTGLAAELLEAARKVGIPANYVADRIRFTSDPVGDGSVVLYGRVNGARALAFEFDRFELKPFDPTPGNHTAEQAELQKCEADGGRLEMGRDVPNASLPLDDGMRLPLQFAQRIRLDQRHRYQVIERGTPDSAADVLSIKRLANVPILLPVVCVRGDADQRPTMVHLDTVADFTRCSFRGTGCEY